jgi:hypothetical protein
MNNLSNVDGLKPPKRHQKAFRHLRGLECILNVLRRGELPSTTGQETTASWSVVPFAQQRWELLPVGVINPPTRTVIFHTIKQHFITRFFLHSLLGLSSPFTKPERERQQLATLKISTVGPGQMAVSYRRMRTSIFVLILGFSIEVSNVVARKIRHARQQKRYRETVQVEKAYKPTSLSSIGLREDEFGRVRENVENGIQQNQRIASLSSSSSSSWSINTKPSQLRRKSQEITLSSSRNLLTQPWNAVSNSFQESIHHSDGLLFSQDSEPSTFRFRDSMNGINQRVRGQQIGAMFAADELEELVFMSMIMSMSPDVR